MTRAAVAERTPGRAERFPAEVADVMQERGIRDARIGVDGLDSFGSLALQEAGLHLEPCSWRSKRRPPRSGAAFDEVGERLSGRLPRACHSQRYPFIPLGSRLSDEDPLILLEDHDAGHIEAGMLHSVEACTGIDGEAEGRLELEEHVLVTGSGVRCQPRTARRAPVRHLTGSLRC